jgi:hypothetical protein
VWDESSHPYDGTAGSTLIHNGLVRGFQSRHWGWWYLSIGLGFLLLAMVYLLRGAGLAPIALRVVVASGFVLLGWMQFRFGR